MIKFSAAQLWVHDQDEALAFYTDKLGMEVQTDVTLPELGDFRWLAVAPPGQDETVDRADGYPGTARVRRGDRRAGPQRDGQGRRGADLPDHRRLSAPRRGAQGPRGRVHRGARGAPLRDRRGASRPYGQRDPAHPAARARLSGPAQRPRVFRNSRAEAREPVDQLSGLGERGAQLASPASIGSIESWSSAIRRLPSFEAVIAFSTSALTPCEASPGEGASRVEGLSP